MPRFAFRLSSLLQVREAERELRRSLLADALAEERAHEARRVGLEGELRIESDRMRAVAGPGALDLASLASAQRYASGLRAQLTALAETERCLAQEILGRRRAVVEADREVRVLEKLRERQHDEHRAAQLRAEGKELDEVAARASGHRRIEQAAASTMVPSALDSKSDF